MSPHLSRPVLRHGRIVSLAVAAGLVLVATPAPGMEPTVAPTNGVLHLKVDEAVLLAMRNHPGFAAERMKPDLQRTFEQEARAAFDPGLNGEFARQESKSVRLLQSGTGTLNAESATTTGALALGWLLPSGTEFALGGSVTNNRLNALDLTATRVGLTVSQALLRGFGTGVNLATLRQTRLDTEMSEFEFRGYAAAFVAAVERTCHDYLLAGRQVDIRRESVRLAEQQAAETVERIRIGKLAEVERAAADAEVALEREALINAENALAAARLRLLGYLHLGGAEAWTCEVTVAPPPEGAGLRPDAIEDHVRVAERLRPELNQARLALRRNELELVKTRNGLLPRMDVFVALGETGYADSFGGSFRGQTDTGNDWQVGLRLDYPLGDRQARARQDRARLTREQQELALDNLDRLVEIDVRSAWLEVTRARAQMDATRSTRRLQEEKLRAETEKFRVGKSTSLLVAQAHRDLVQSEVNEAQAVTGCLNALTELHRLDGSLLARRGIVTPGAETVSPEGGEAPSAGR